MVSAPTTIELLTGSGGGGGRLLSHPVVAKSSMEEDLFKSGDELSNKD
jgi:hypothetical protein